MSRVLSGTRPVGADLRERVLKAAAELGYQPDLSAQAMRTGRSKAVGYVVSDFSNPLFSAIAMGADSVLYPRGYSLVLVNSANDPKHEARAMSALRHRRVESLLISLADETDAGLASRLRAFDSVVLLDREVPGASPDAVCSDHALGMAQALARLVELGHGRIALVAGSQVQRGGRARVEAFRAHLGDRLDENLVRTGELSAETGYFATHDLLSLAQPPTALIAGNNQLFVGVLEAVRDRRLSIPVDISLVTCDDVDLARLHDPPIDVINRQPIELGQRAAELTLERLADPQAPQRRVLLPTYFEARASSVSPEELVA